MRKYLKTILWVIVFLSLLIFAIYILKNDKGELKKIIFETDVSNISSLNIKSDISYEVKKTSYGYGLFVPENVPGNLEVLEDMMKSSAKIEYISIIDNEPSDLNQFGLLNPSKTLTINLNTGTSKIIYIGGKTPANDGVYVKLEDGNTIYKISDITANRITQNANDIINKTLISFNNERLSRIKLEYNETIMELIKSDDIWYYNGQQLDKNISNQIIDMIQVLSVEGILDKSDYITDTSNPNIILTFYEDEKEEFIISLFATNDKYVVIKNDINVQYYYYIYELENVKAEITRLFTQAINNT